MRPRHSSLRSVSTGLLFLSILVSNGLSAQIIEEVIVTAQKRPQSLQEVAVSVGAMDDRIIGNLLSGDATILDLAGRSPSLYAESSNGRLIPRLYIRGLGNTDFDINASQPVSLIYDDVVLENPALKSFPLFDIKSVEILRGPQGSLFGRNTTGGIVKIESYKPGVTREGYALTSFGQRGYKKIDVAYGGSIIHDNTITGRAAFRFQSMRDWVDNLAPGHEIQNATGGYQELAGRVQISWQPNNRFSALLNVHGRNHSDGSPTLFYANVIKKGTSELASGFDREKLYQDAVLYSSQHQRMRGVTTTIRYSFDRVNLTFISGRHAIPQNISRGDVDGGYGSVFAGVLPSGPEPGIPFDAQTSDALTDHQQVTQEFRVENLSHESRFQWRVGAYRFSEKFKIETINYDSVLSPGSQNGFVHQIQKTVAWALFGTVDLHFTDRLTTNWGMRYSSDSKDFTSERTQSPLSSFGVGPIGPLTVEPSDSVFTGDVSFLYEINPEINLYVRFARGHRAPSVQGRLLFQDMISVADTEINHSLEIGLKGLYLNRRMQLNTSSFLYQISNQQLTKVGGPENINQLINADRTLGHGFETELDLYLNENWLSSIGVSYNSTRIDDPGLSVNGCGSAMLLLGCTITDPQLPNGEFSIDGNSLYYAPEWMANVLLRFDKPFRNVIIFFQTDWMWHSDHRFTLYESEEFRDDGVLEGGVRLGMTTGDQKLTCAIYGRNITDDTSLVGGVDFNNLTGMINSPREWGLDVRRKF